MTDKKFRLSAWIKGPVEKLVKRKWWQIWKPRYEKQMAMNWEQKSITLNQKEADIVRTWDKDINLIDNRVLMLKLLAGSDERFRYVSGLMLEEIRKPNNYIRSEAKKQ